MPAPAAMATTMLGLVTAFVVALRGIGLRGIGLCRISLPRLRLWLTLPASGVLAQAALDDLVELATIQPHTPAFGTIVDLDALPLAHHEIHPADGTKESLGPVGGRGIRGIHHFRLQIATPMAGSCRSGRPIPLSVLWRQMREPAQRDGSSR